MYDGLLLLSHKQLHLQILSVAIALFLACLAAFSTSVSVAGKVKFQLILLWYIYKFGSCTDHVLEAIIQMFLYSYSQLFPQSFDFIIFLLELLLKLGTSSIHLDLQQQKIVGYSSLTYF